MRLHRHLLFILFICLARPFGPVSSHAQSIRFEDSSELAGVQTLAGAYGIAVADYDKDGWDDIYIGTENGQSVLLKNLQNGTFANVTERSGVQVAGTVANPLWGDINSDGYPDLFVGKLSADVSCQLFLGSSEGIFTEVTEFSGIDISDDIGSATFGDYNLDGRIDLFIATRGSEDYLFENIHDGASVYFKDISQRAGVGGESFAVPMQATWVDYDNDFDLDLFALHDGNLQSRFYKNSSFLPLIEVSSSSKLRVARSSMGVAWGDYDNDGWQDVYITNIDQGNLFKNLGNGRFEDVTIESGSGLNGMSWGVVFVDFDNDGDEDLFIGNTFDFDGRHSFLYENDQGTFTNIARDAGVALNTNTFGVATGDFNRDGLMDLIVADDSGDNRLLLNRASQNNHWAQFTLKGDVFNPMAVGATLFVYAGEHMYTRSVYAGSSYRSQVSPTVHVGLADAALIDSLYIHWGPEETEVYYGVDVNKSYEIVQNRPLRVEIDANEHSAVPGRLDVSAFPNPFLSQTTFNILIPLSSRARLDIYDTMGRKVNTVLDKILPPGEHRVSFNAEALSAGMYFYRLTSESSVQTGSLLLVR